MYYILTVCRDRERSGHQLVVHWDDDDPNTVIAQTFTAKAITNDVIEQAAARIGFRVVSTDSDNAARGWALVTRFDSDRPFFNPADRSWSSVASR
ncbi:MULTISPECIES: hypothetical protein [Mycobacterium]|uniref:Uncharacterized protein n=1 Tax=Mycobacterium kyorinense TaxID=487514 RepID=A0A1X1Y173_9MYCO|nr:MULTISPECIES: hypothetical protein [Mycobacterium]ORW04862.1 hypothetical protein AWC14_02380 [Mycobacterium kyorinense]